MHPSGVRVLYMPRTRGVEALAGHLERETVFLFYSESGLSEKLGAALAEAGILIADPAKLATYETPSGL